MTTSETRTLPEKWQADVEDGAVPIAVPGLHEKFLSFFRVAAPLESDPRVLDLGCGFGSISGKLHGLGYRVAACDLYPEAFRVPGVECRAADLTEPLPYEDGEFDALLAVEVMEHLTDHVRFLRECARVLRPGGQFLMTTPNILSLKSRIRFLVLGYYYSFRPLEVDRADGEQHVSGLTLDEYEYRARRAGLVLERAEVDTYQTTSKAWIFLLPVVRLTAALAKLGRTRHNRLRFLLGRKLFLAFRKEGS